MDHRWIRWVAPITVAVALPLASCGGGSSTDSSDSACEQVSAGTSSLTIRNELSSGLQAYLPQAAFGADMAAGECNIIGLGFSDPSVDIQVELTQCTNSPDNTDCTNKTFGATRVRTVTLPQGESRTLTVDSSVF